jgi:hypothetical protein
MSFLEAKAEGERCLAAFHALKRVESKTAWIGAGLQAYLGSCFYRGVPESDALNYLRHGQRISLFQFDWS